MNTPVPPGRIESVTSTLYRLPMPRPWGEVDSQHLLVTELRTSTGAAGTGFSWAVRAGGRAIRAMVDADTGPAAIGLNYGIKLIVKRPRPVLKGLPPLGGAPSSLSF